MAARGKHDEIVQALAQETGVGADQVEKILSRLDVEGILDRDSDEVRIDTLRIAAGSPTV